MMALKENAAPTGIGSGDIAKYLVQLSTPTYSESLGVRRIIREYRISVPLARTVAELAGIGGDA